MKQCEDDYVHACRGSRGSRRRGILEPSTAGVDTASAHIGIHHESQEAAVRTATEFQVRASDEGDAGIHEARPVSGRVALRNAEETLCGPDISASTGEDERFEYRDHSRDRRLQEQHYGPYHDHRRCRVVRTDIFVDVPDLMMVMRLTPLMRSATIPSRERHGTTPAMYLMRLNVQSSMTTYRPSVGISALAATAISMVPSM